MLQECYNRNNSVTNGDSGSKSAIVKFGHQIVHRQFHGITRACAPYSSYYIRAGELEAGSWKLSWKLEAEQVKLYYDEN